MPGNPSSGSYESPHFWLLYLLLFYFFDLTFDPAFLLVTSPPCNESMARTSWDNYPDPNDIGTLAPMSSLVIQLLFGEDFLRGYTNDCITYCLNEGCSNIHIQPVSSMYST